MKQCVIEIFSLNLLKNFVFLDMGKVKSAKINYAIPGDALDQKEFETMIRKAEKGTFHTIEAAKAELEKWKAKYSK
ncbi:MAG: hypothetical protein ABI203_08255 [Mucilaginibacter sp.]